jgi:dTDP-4-dehydrorhamnose reductase
VQQPSRILIVGGDSAIGAELRKQLDAAGQTAVATTRRKSASGEIYLDLAEPASWDLPPGLDAAILCAGITGEAACRADPDLARRVNVTNTVTLVRTLAAAGTRVVFLSTDLVSGDPPQAYAPTDGLYAGLKAEAENAIAALPRAVIVRLGKVLTPEQPLITRWIGELRAGRPIEAFDDHWMSPITFELAATGILDAAQGQAQGVAYVTGQEHVGYHTFACALAEALGVSAELVRATSAKGVSVGAKPATIVRTEAPDHRSVARSLVRGVKTLSPRSR